MAKRSVRLAKSSARFAARIPSVPRSVQSHVSHARRSVASPSAHIVHAQCLVVHLAIISLALDVVKRNWFVVTNVN